MTGEYDGNQNGGDKEGLIFAILVFVLIAYVVTIALLSM